MNVELTLEPHDVLTVALSDGDQRAVLSVHPAQAGGASLQRALEAALQDGYGECFWPAWTGGQYWWIFKRDDNALELIAMWTRGGVAIWEHVFRATDSTEWVVERVQKGLKRVGLGA